MYSLPATVPEGETSRNDVVPARLARRTATLFGVTWPGAPFGRTWLCDFSGLTLAEVARGAPLPPRGGSGETGNGEGDAAPFSDTSDTGHQLPTGNRTGDRAWKWVGRGVWMPSGGSGPNTIATATLNRLGPDTKAAAVLTGVNRLLREATAAVTAVARHLAAGDIDPQLRLAVWAGLVLEVYRAQPALVVAGIQARAVQRSLTTRWGSHIVVPAAVAEAGGARCELPRGTGTGAGTSTPGDDRDAAEDPLYPTRLDLVDATLPLLQLRAGKPASSRNPAPGDIVGDRLDDIAEAWCRRLLQVGRPGRGIVWVEERDGHRQAHTYLRVGAVVAPFVAETFDAPLTARLTRLPPLPERDALADVPVLHRRAHLIAVHVAANVLRYRDELLQAFPAVRERTAERVAEGAVLAERLLGADDPVTYLLRGYQLYLDLWDRSRTSTARAGTALTGTDRTGHLDDVIAASVAFQSEIVGANRRGSVDPATTTYLLELTNTALVGARPDAADPAAVDRAVARAWRDCLAARGLDGGKVLDDPAAVPAPHAFHLHHFAEHVAARGRPVDLRRALAVQERVCEVRDDVVARERVGYPAKAVAARTSHELAASLAVRLARALPSGDRTTAEALQGVAETHALAVLDNPSTAVLLRARDPGAAALATARAVLPVLADTLDLLPTRARRRARSLARVAATTTSGTEADRFRAIADPAS